VAEGANALVVAEEGVGATTTAAIPVSPANRAGNSNGARSESCCSQ
jgi:hypothetical protein